MRTRVGYLGGTFDPVHAGHLRIAELAQRALNLERVEFVPSGHPPHKRPEELASALARWTMVELALLDQTGMVACPRELFSERPTYTIETLEAIERERRDEEPWWILGTDALASIETWHRSRELLERFRFVVVARPRSIRIEELRSSRPLLRRACDAGRLLFLEGPCHPASSTTIRNRLRGGQDLPRNWLPSRVLHYVRKYRLYR